MNLLNVPGKLIALKMKSMNLLIVLYEKERGRIFFLPLMTLSKEKKMCGFIISNEDNMLFNKPNYFFFHQYLQREEIIEMMSNVRYVFYKHIKILSHIFLHINVISLM
jgi:hypothetical protein